MDPLLSTVTLDVKRGKLRVESPRERIKQVNTLRVTLHSSSTKAELLEHGLVKSYIYQYMK